jgi:hypothetical protein
MKKEVNTLVKRGIWQYADHPGKGVNVVDSKWVFRRKTDAQGKVTQHKARLVARGFTQINGVDYFSDDTFAPVCKLTSARTILAHAAKNNWLVHQLDVKSAYLYGKLEEDEQIYMRPPPGIQLSGIKPGQVLLLLLALYGLKQAGRRWYKVLWAIMSEIGLKRSEFDHAVFYRHIPNGSIAIIFVHVDDMSLVASSQDVMDSLKSKLTSRLEIVDSGAIHWLLGIEIRRNITTRTIHLSQRAYLEAIIARYGFADTKPRAVPMDPHLHLSREQCPTTVEDFAKMKDKPYREALGALMYAAVATRPDLAFAIGQLARYQDSPGIVHWNALKHVYQYLKGTLDLELVLGASHEHDSDFTGYSDADGMSTEGRHAISGYVFLVGSGAVSWSSKRQDIVTLSTTEAEYVALTHAAKEATWLRSFIMDVFGSRAAPITLFSDNQSAIALARDDRFHARTKHIDIRFHFIRYVIADGRIKLEYCPTEDMVADVLTKALPSMKAKHFASSMGLRRRA